MTIFFNRLNDHIHEMHIMFISINSYRKWEFYSRSKPRVVVAEHSFYEDENDQQHTVYTGFTTVELH